MKSTLAIASPRTTTSPSRRRQLLAEFERSGMSVADFAREHGIAYSTFCAWRRGALEPGLCFAEVEVVRPGPEPIVVELGSQARMRLSSGAQLELAAQLLKRLEAAC